MTTKRVGRAERTTTTTRTSKSVRPTQREDLSPREEKVLRMRRGTTVPSDAPLGRVGQEHAKTKAWLDALEQRAFERSGRLDQLRREAGVAPASAAQPTPVASRAAAKTAPADSVAKKEKIISRLAKKAPSASKPKAPARPAAPKARARKR